MDTPKVHKLTLKPSGDAFEIEEGKNLLEALTEHNIFVKSSCGGVASCRDCIIKILLGKENLNSPTHEELRIMGNVFFITKERLSCQTTITGDVEIEILN